MGSPDNPGKLEHQVVSRWEICYTIITNQAEQRQEVDL